MPRERETNSKKIKFVDYDIDGNQIRAYYDGARELIFVLDETINADKPNVLLVLDSFDNRKWDDVLANDYGIDLETVRPKRDNKYQKLDIEYGGLDVYAELIDAYDSDGDIDEALENLNRFRIMSVRRAATERLAAANDTAAKSRETIERTNETISELRARLKELRAKLSEQKRGIGREPTKASASKILKTEAQIDATNEKLARAKKRLSSAQRRLLAAENDAEIARAILAARHADVKSSRRVASKPVRAPKPRPVAVQSVEEDEEAVDDYSDEYEDVADYDESAEDEVDNNDVKPLFDTDPNVLDENIAFKPIDFDASNTYAQPAPVAPSETREPVVAPAPLSFTPPSENVPEQSDDNTNNAPMLDNITSVTETETIETAVDETPTVMPEPVVEPEPIAEITPAEPIPVAEPVAPVRPVSPITGDTINQTEVRYTKRPTLLYYIMLILLIALSIFTLWLYQSRNGATLPEITAPTPTTETAKPKPTVAETNIPSPFVNPVTDKPVEPAVVAEPEQVSEPEPIAEEVAPVVEPEPVAVTVSEPEPIAEEPEPVAVDVVATPEPDNVTVESPFVDLRTVANYEPEKKPIPTEEEVLARKPGYSVSQNEKMFVAAPDYDTETVVEQSATFSPDTDVQPMPVVEDNIPEIVASDVVVGESEPVTCADGAAADEYGCCPGEIYLYTADGYMCCAGDDCFPPLQ